MYALLCSDRLLLCAVQDLPDGTKDDPVLAKFETEITKYKAVAQEIQQLPSTANIGWMKINAKPLKQVCVSLHGCT
jgi:hypothetical protein